MTQQADLLQKALAGGHRAAILHRQLFYCLVLEVQQELQLLDSGIMSRHHLLVPHRLRIVVVDGEGDIKLEQIH